MNESAFTGPGGSVTRRLGPPIELSSGHADEESLAHWSTDRQTHFFRGCGLAVKINDRITKNNKKILESGGPRKWSLGAVFFFFSKFYDPIV